MTVHHTPNYGIAYIDVDTALVDLAQASQEVATTLDAALGAVGVVPPGAQDLVAIDNRLDVLEARLADVTLGDAAMTAEVTLNASPTYTDIATVTAIASGGEVVLRWNGCGFNAASGQNRSMAWRVLCDSTVVGSLGGIVLELANLPRIPKSGVYKHTPTAGQHTWKLQATGSTAGAVNAIDGRLSVVERFSL